jgi:MoaA/NifB/PqqE/SkfB family radical SAM enzyme
VRLPEYVEIETSRFCNRQCAWCPNHVLKDRTVQELMEWPVFETIVGSLAAKDYEGWLAFHNYNEPLANPRLVEEVRFARAHVPRARLTVYTNGDHLTTEKLDALAAAGLSQMRVTIYPPDNDVAASHARLYQWLSRRPFLAAGDWYAIDARQGPALGRAGAPELLLISPEVGRYYDRGGVLPHLSIAVRTKPCMLTSHSLSVDYRGNVKMCCNVLAAVDAHQVYLLGNVRERDIFDVWNSDTFEKIRENHRRADWSATPVCVSCRQEIAAS